MSAVEFIPLAMVHFMVVLSPGPDFALTMKSTLSGGRPAGFRTALGISAGTLVQVTYTLVGLGCLVQSNPEIYQCVAWLGAAYLAFLGLTMLRSAISTWSAAALVPQFVMAIPEDESESSHPFRMGFLTSVTNPKTTLFFVAIFKSLVSPDTPLWQQLAYGIWMCCVNIAWFGGVSVLFSDARLRQAYIERRHWIDTALGVLLVSLATRVAVVSAWT